MPETVSGTCWVLICLMHEEVIILGVVEFMLWRENFENGCLHIFIVMNILGSMPVRYLFFVLTTIKQKY